MAPHSALNQTLVVDYPSSYSQETPCSSPQTPRQALSANKTASSRQIGKKSVGFHKVVKIHKVLHLSQYSNQEISSCWYSGEEFEIMREDAEDAAEAFENGKMMIYISSSRDGAELCSRGLEGLTYKGSLEKRQTKDAGIDAVLDEQELQDEEGIEDQDDIAHVYKIVSSSAQAKAYAIGLRDELDAMMCEYRFTYN